MPKERAAGLPVFAVALRCIPYIIPEHWEGAKLAEELPGAPLHGGSAAALQYCMLTVPDHL